MIEDALTVVLLTYNHEDTISRAFDSILEQKLDVGYRILVLEDCSTDRTAAVCKEYQRKYPGRVYLRLNNKNLGVAANLKQGLVSIKSKYFAFLEGDDYWCDKRKLQLQIDALDNNPDCVLCGHNTHYMDWINNKERLFVGSESGVQDGNKYGLEVNFRVHPSSRMYRNLIDLTDVPPNMLFDTHIYRLYLMEGKLVYLDRVMSVFNNTGNGFWSGRSYWDKKLMTLELSYEANRYFNYIHDKEYFGGSKPLGLLKRILGVRKGWIAFFYIQKIRILLMRRLGTVKGSG